MRVLFFQHGDYGEAYHRLRAGGPETYRDQRHSVDFVASLAQDREITTLAICDRPHDEELAPGLQSIGIPRDAAWNRDRLRALLERLCPDVLVCRTPNWMALEWAATKRIPTLPVFADIFSGGGIRNRLNNWRLGRVLRRCIRPCVANHSLSASQSLRRLGLSPGEIVPWEFQRLHTLGNIKHSPSAGRPFRLFYAGNLIESKGVGDCIEAVAIARTAGDQVELSLAGPGDSARWVALARQLGVSEYVHTLGQIPSERVLAEMSEHDAVVVPSRHDYAEGLPNTIFEALSSCSPLIISDHPAFVNRLLAGEAALQFQAARPQSLAEQILRLIQEPDLYCRLSRNSASALDGLYVGIEWTRLIVHFLEAPLGPYEWVQRYTLSALARR